LSTPTNNQIYQVPADQFSPSAGTSLLFSLERAFLRDNKKKMVCTNLQGSCQSNFSLCCPLPIEKLCLQIKSNTHIPYSASILTLKNFKAKCAQLEEDVFPPFDVQVKLTNSTKIRACEEPGQKVCFP